MSWAVTVRMSVAAASVLRFQESGPHRHGPGGGGMAMKLSYYKLIIESEEEIVIYAKRKVKPKAPCLVLTARP